MTIILFGYCTQESFPLHLLTFKLAYRSQFQEHCDKIRCQLSKFAEQLPGEGSSTFFFVRGCSKLTLENRPSLYLEKRDFETHHFTNLSQKTPKLGQIGCFFGQIFQNTPNFANWADWVWNENPPIDIPKIMKNHPKNSAPPRIPFVSENPPRALNRFT